MFNVMNKLQFFCFVIFAIISCLAICYFAEHDRTILLLGVYPAIAFSTLGFVFWCESEN